MEYKLKFKVALVLVLVLTVKLSSGQAASLEPSAVTLHDVILPPGTYTMKIYWGNYSASKTFEVTGVQDLKVNVSASNIRSQLKITLVRGETVVLSVILRPSVVGYEVAELNKVEVVEFKNSSQAIRITEVVSIVDATIVWVPEGGVVTGVKLNGVELPKFTVDKNSIHIESLVIDDYVIVEAEVAERGKVYAMFGLGKEGLDVSSKFTGNFTHVEVYYDRSVREMEWVVAIPTTIAEGSKEFEKESGVVTATKGETKPMETKPSSEGESKPTGRASKEEETGMGAGSLDEVKKFLNNYRYEVLTLAGILFVAGVARQIIPLAVLGAVTGLTAILILLI
ncbi:MAG: hypothetical protein QXT26_06775 [Thermoproteota archaeon]